jgi:hypothetical protein
MGKELEQYKKFSARRLKYDGPRVRNKYIYHYEQYMEKKKLRDRSRKLASDAKELGLTQQQEQEYEQLDALRKKRVYESQQQCRKFRTGEKDWSPKNDTTWNQSPFLEVGMQQGLWGQGSTTVSYKAKEKGTIEEC